MLSCNFARSEAVTAWFGVAEAGFCAWALGRVRRDDKRRKHMGAREKDGGCTTCQGSRMRGALEALEAHALARGLAGIGEVGRSRKRRYGRRAARACRGQMLQGMQDQPGLRNQQGEDGHQRQRHASGGAQLC